MHQDASPVVFLLNNPRKVYLNTIIEKQSIINREGGVFDRLLYAGLYFAREGGHRA